MEPSWILVDSNSYFRLAKLKHPLLQQKFGNENYCLVVIPELDVEYARSQKLKSKFAWVKEPQYVANRKSCLDITAETSNKIWNTNSIIKETAKDMRLGTSHVDTMCLSYGIELGIPIVTDDLEMTQLAKVFGLKMLSTLEIMHLMAKSDFISMELALGIVREWISNSDTPKEYRKNCVRLFGTKFLKELGGN